MCAACVCGVAQWLGCTCVACVGRRHPACGCPLVAWSCSGHSPALRVLLVVTALRAHHRRRFHLSSRQPLAVPCSGSPSAAAAQWDKLLAIAKPAYNAVTPVGTWWGFDEAAPVEPIVPVQYLPPVPVRCSERDVFRCRFASACIPSTGCGSQNAGCGDDREAGTHDLVQQWPPLQSCSCIGRLMRLRCCVLLT